MNRLFIFVISLFVSTCLSAYSSSDVQAYIEKYKELARKIEQEYHVPAPIVLAQAIVESGAGTSRLAVQANNHFGYKAYSDWKGETFKAIDDHPYPSSFRKYRSAEESFEDYGRLIQRKYSNHKWAIFNYRNWAKHIQDKGYASGKNYARKLIVCIELYQLYKINGGGIIVPKIISGSNPKSQRTQKKVGSQNSQVVQSTSKRNDIVEITEPEQDREDDDYITEEEYNEEQRMKQLMMEIYSRHETDRNNVGCTILYPGQRIGDIAYEYKIPEKKILKYNEISTDFNFDYGDYVYLEKKASKYTGHEDYHWAKEGEDLYKVSQLYGIKLSSLQKLNKGIPFDLPEGTQVRLR